MSNYEYSSYSSSSSTGGANGVGPTDALFTDVDTNKDGYINRGEFRNWLSSGASGVGQAGFGAGGASNSYESSSYTSMGGDTGFFGAGGASSFDYSSSASFGGSDSYDAEAVSQAANYTADTNAAWSRYGAEVRGTGLYADSNPQIIRRQAPGGVQTYTQNIKVRFLQPPPVPPPGPLIIKEVRPPQPPPLPPLRIRQQAPPRPKPPPLILRERPPRPPSVPATQTVIRRLAALPVPPRSVIIERIPAAPPRPRDIIIERWIPYGPVGKRRTIVQRAAAAKRYPAPRNVIIQYEPVQVRVVRQFQRLGVTQEDPQAYMRRYGARLLDAQTLLQEARAAGVVEDISPPAAIGSGFRSASFSQGSSFGTGDTGRFGYAEGIGGADIVGENFGGASSLFSPGSVETFQGGASSLVGGGVEGAFGGETAGVGNSSSSHESVSLSSRGGATGTEPTTAAFSSADTNKDGRLDYQEFSSVVQGGNS